ncbi:hypothetical protein [Vibrio alginolyticus]|uniref:hypothetical protein n=1 Tax=Vibrio alginolyticus TaxID=663 RepID=UPI000722154E|nr:hypothetical protein [Vibrio alginolyticus]ALR95752.1 hypothetical protein AT730_26315 [Vibrio alginolyticus]ALR95805.1 hypothetical protein AT730_24650 [Vibrio alginolyticus]MBY7710971.1 hypothetical protein [Vibrio alginolyticus]
MRGVILLSLVGVMGSVYVWAEEPTMEHPTSDTGVTFIDAQSQNEVLRQYLLPTPILVDEDQSDEALYEFMNQKMKWEEND